MTPEEKSTERVRLRASSHGMRVFRNNSGVLMNPVGVPVRFGLGNESKKLNKILKSSDLLGVHEIEITPEMVGKKIGVFVALEVKPDGFKIKEEYPEGSREYAQLKFMNLIKKFGGLAGFATNENDVDRILNDFLIGLKEQPR